MKKTKKILLLLLTLLLSSAVFSACTQMLKNDNNLLEADYRYIVEYKTNGGYFGSQLETARLYFKDDGFPVMEPNTSSFLNISRTNYEIVSWYYLDPQDSTKEIEWEFETNGSKTLVTKDMMAYNSQNDTHVFTIYPRWSMSIVYNYRFVLVNETDYAYSSLLDGVVSKSVPGENADRYKGFTEGINGVGRLGLSEVLKDHTVIPEDYDGTYKEYLAPKYYLDEQCTELVTFPLPREHRPVTVSEEELNDPDYDKENPANEATLYVKCLQGTYNILKNKTGEVTKINLNQSGKYYLWNDIDLNNTTLNSLPVFSGTILGNGYKLMNFKVEKTSVDKTEYNAAGLTYVGLFGTLTGAMINNLTITNAQVLISLPKVPENLTARFGILAGAVTNSVITNVRLIDSNGFIKPETINNAVPVSFTEIGEFKNMFYSVEKTETQRIISENTKINVFNAELSKTSDTENGVNTSYNIANNEFVFGITGQTFTSHTANATTGRPGGKYAGLMITFGAIDGVKMNVNNKSHTVDQLAAGLTLDGVEFLSNWTKPSWTQEDGYILYIYQPERVKNTSIAILWNDWIRDDFSIVINVNNARIANRDTDVTNTKYDAKTNTLTILPKGNEKIKNYAEGNTKNRPEGYSLLLYLQIFNDKGFTVQVGDGEPQNIEDLTVDTKLNPYRCNFILEIPSSDIREFKIFLNFGDYTSIYTVIIADAIEFEV